MFLSSLAYLILFLTLWCAGLFEYITHSVAPFALYAGLLWACTAAVSPLLWWSSRDRDNLFIMTMVEGAQAAIIVLSIVRLAFGESSFWSSFAVLGGIIGLLTAAQVIYEEKFLKKMEGPR